MFFTIMEVAKRIQSGHRQKALTLLRASKPSTEDYPAIKSSIMAFIRPERVETILSEPRWGQLAGQFKKVYCRYTGLEGLPKLEEEVLMGCYLLKTQHCRKGCSSDCPACQPSVQRLAVGLPLSKKSTTFYCPVTGQQVSRDSPIFVMPDGEAFSREGLDQKYGGSPAGIRKVFLS